MDTAERPSYAGRHRCVDASAPGVPGYAVTGLLGRGASGSVWSATSEAGTDVAIKVVPVADADDSLVELAVLGRIRDSHLVRLHEALALPSGEVALVLDLLSGGTVGSLVRTRGHLSPGELVTVLSPVASTLARLHGCGVVHGDLSPDNILLDHDGRPFVADLGVAGLVGGRTDEVWGTEGFVAPEVLAGQRPSAAADVHALGALAWFCLTGSPPGPAGMRGRLADQAPGVPDALADAIEGALRTSAQDRPDADELALALFDSVAAQPLELAEHGGAEDVALLTRRIRAAARTASEDARPARPRSAGWLGRPVRSGRPAWLARPVWLGRAGRSGRPAWLARPVWLGRPGWSGRPGWRALGQWVAFVVVAALAGGLLAWHGLRDEALAEPSSAGAPAAVGTDVRMLADAPRRDPKALVDALADARAAAWSSGVAARLVEVDAPRSPALASDTEVLAEVQRMGQRYVGLSFVVRDARLESGSGERATVRAAIDTSAHVVRGPSGDVSRPAVVGAPVLLDLVRTPSGWRVAEVRAA
ncbi:serine/threonine-protein kinase [Knoellia sp. CPCC 206450]|uniref:serine/threonine-protein kinase n=1 Tax=Knoellia tibetensis TaxID=3404798 RepID=UPI003B43A292